MPTRIRVRSATGGAQTRVGAPPAALERHIDVLRKTAEEIAAGEPRAQLEIEVRRQYPTMRRYLEAYPEVVQPAERAIRAKGIEPRRTPIRGGTDLGRRTRSQSSTRPTTARCGAQCCKRTR